MVDVVASAEEQAKDGDGVGDVEQDDAGCDHAVEGGVGSQVQAADYADNHAGDEVSSEGYAEVSLDLG